MKDNDERKPKDFILTTSLIMRIFIFALLGSQVNFARLQQYFRPALALVIIYILVGRPLVVSACARPCASNLLMDKLKHSIFNIFHFSAYPSKS